MWGTFLSEPLRIVALVGRYPANKLMRRMPIHRRNLFLLSPGDVSLRSYAVLDRISPAYPPAMGRLHTCYSPVRRSPAAEASFSPAAPRLACVKPVASVHPEPGSNSSLLYLVFSFSFKKRQDLLLNLPKARLPRVRTPVRARTDNPASPGVEPFIVLMVEIDRVNIYCSCTTSSLL